MTHYSWLCMTHTPTVSCSRRCLANGRHDQFFQERWSSIPKLFVPCLGFDWQGWSYLFANFCPSSNAILEESQLNVSWYHYKCISFIYILYIAIRCIVHIYIIMSMYYVFHIAANYLSPMLQALTIWISIMGSGRAKSPDLSGRTSLSSPLKERLALTRSPGVKYWMKPHDSNRNMLINLCECVTESFACLVGQRRIQTWYINLFKSEILPSGFERHFCIADVCTQYAECCRICANMKYVDSFSINMHGAYTAYTIHVHTSLTGQFMGSDNVWWPLIIGNHSKKENVLRDARRLGWVFSEGSGSAHHTSI